MGTDSDAGVAAPTASPVAAVVLAAGAGVRLRPLTLLRPKPLCPVGERPLLDWALDRLAGLDDLDVAVNVHHGAGAVVDHLQRRLDGLVAPDGTVTSAMAPRRGRRRVAGAGAAGPTPRVVVSWEEPVALGTAGALARLRPWLDGRGALVVNGDTWTDLDLGPLLAGWAGERPRVLTVGDGGFGPSAPVAGALVPWSTIAELPDTPSGLWERCWRQALEDGTLEVVGGSGHFVDCGTPADYLRANDAARALALARRATGTGEAGGGAGSVAEVLHAERAPTCVVGPGAVVSGHAERSVIGAGALVEGTVVDSVVWPGAHVAEGEHLVAAVRADGPLHERTVLVR